MKKHILIWTALPLAMAALLVLGPATAGWAGDGDEEEEIPFDDASIFFELNNTDEDLGIHALIDGEPWKKLVIEMPNERENLQIRLKNRFRRQGLTELFFESAEPNFEEFSAEEFFERFPEGEYEIEGVTLEGDELESIAIVTHLMPAPPEIEVNGEALPEDCEDDPVPAVSEPFVVSWEEITMSHPELGRTSEPIEVEQYQVVVEREADPPVNISIEVSPDVTEVELPNGLLEPGDEIKIEVLVREESGNQTATESCFEVEE